MKKQFLLVAALAVLLSTASFGLIGSADAASPTAPPAQVTGLTVSSKTDTSVTLSWTANAAGDSVDTYQAFENDAIHDLNVTGTTDTITGLTASTSYTFRVSAHNAVGYGQFTGTVTATTNAPPGPTAAPVVPTGVTATATDTTVTLTWNANPSSDFVDRYQVYKNNGSGGYPTIADGPASPTYTVTGLTANTTYSFRVGAHNSIGYGPWTDPATSITTAPPPAAQPTETGRWYSTDSPWNTPIPANPQIATGNSSMISTFTTNAVIGVVSSSTPSVAYAQATTPNVTVQINYPTCNNRTMQIPIPAGTNVEGSPSNGASSPESHLVVVAPDGTEYDMFKVTKPNAATLSSGPVCSPSANWAATVVSARGPTIGWQSKADVGPSYRGSNTAAGAGTIRKRDMQAADGTASMDHALAISYAQTYIPNSGAYPNFVYPAASTDGKGLGYPNGIPEGARLQLDPSINCDTWPSLVGGPAWKRTLCKTLQSYGGIVVDTGNGVYMEWYQDSGTDWVSGLNGFNWNSNKLPSDLYSHFRVLDWNWHWAGGNP